MKLTEHFDSREFRCRCGDKGLEGPYFCGGIEILPAPELVDKLEQVRQHFGRPVRINSGYRCPAYNEHIGGAKQSQHVRATAADIVVDGVDPAEVADFAEILGFGGIGRYKTFTHVDVRPNGPARWQG